MSIDGSCQSPYAISLYQYRKNTTDRLLFIVSDDLTTMSHKDDIRESQGENLEKEVNVNLIQPIMPDEEMARVQDGVQAVSLSEPDNQADGSNSRNFVHKEEGLRKAEINAEDMALNQNINSPKASAAGNNDLPEVNNSLTMYRMQSLLSQSTGQERELPKSNSESSAAPRAEIPGNVLHDVPQLYLEKQQQPPIETGNINKKGFATSNAPPHNTPIDHSKSNKGSQNTSLSSGSANSNPNSTSNVPSNKDSLIFQQSGITLNNLHMNPLGKNAQISSLSRTSSQQSLQRQESYLSFRVSDKSQGAGTKSNLSLSNANNGSIRERSKETSLATSRSTSSNQFDKLDSKQSSRGNEVKVGKEAEKTGGNTSLLSQQAKNKNKPHLNDQEYQEVDLSKLDLSSYLSSQESEPETRTQQKLWLQRENVATLNDSEEMDNGNTAHIVNQTSRFQYEQLSREFLQIRRYKNPVMDSLKRLDRDGLSNKKVDIDSKSNKEINSAATSLAKSAKQQYIPASVSKSLDFRSKEASLTEDEHLQVNLDEINETLADIWKQNCINFKEMNLMKKKHYEQQKMQQQQQQQQQHHHQHPHANHFQQQHVHQNYPVQNSDQYNGALLSSRYGYQPNNGSSQLANIFARGNRASVGQTAMRASSSGLNKVGNTNPQHGNGINKFHPTTRAQQQQQYRQEQMYQQMQQQNQDLNQQQQQQRQG